MMTTPAIKIRLDKWLWAARFFKTRNLAKKAIEGGKVHHEGQRVKVSKEISVGDLLVIRQGWDEKTVEVLLLSDQRRGAPQAEQLYQETQESLTKRTEQAAQQKAQNAAFAHPLKRPTKKQRRQIHRFREDMD
jgi:ribosome-associated heat shock protein Hsp15